MSKQSHSISGKSKPSAIRAVPRAKRVPPTGPGRPTAARAEAINKAILGKAYKLFWKLGYAHTQMEAIAEAVGISKRTLYDRYPNKFSLLTAVIESRTSALTNDEIFSVKDGSYDLRTRLKQRARIAMDYCCSGEYERSDRFWRGCPPTKDLLRLFYERGHKRQAEIIAAEIVELSPKQSISFDAALQLSEMFISSLYGWWASHFTVRHIPDEEAHSYGEHVVDALFDGHSSWSKFATQAPKQSE